jgi:2-hydroxychromene-2-carboxylate isomerase
MGKNLEFFFDYGSPWSYMADSQLAALTARTGATITYVPMLLGGVFKATGNQSPANSPVQAKLRYGGLDMMRWVRRYGVPFKRNPHFPVNTMKIMRGAIAAQMRGFFPRYHRTMFAGMWEQELKLDDDAVIRAALEAAGLDATSLFQSIEQQEVKDKLRANTDLAVARGVFGAPAFFVDDELYWGNDRLDFVEAALTGEGSTR